MKNYILLFFLLLILSCHKDKLEIINKPTNLFYEKAWNYLDQHIQDSSFIYFNKAKEEFLKQNDSIGVAKSLINMAIISGDQGDYFGSQEISLSAIKYLDSNVKIQREILSSNYNNLGKISQILKKYARADQFYKEALELAINKPSKNIYIGNIAINLSDQKKYNEALKYFEYLLSNKLTNENSRNLSRVLSNISKTKWLQNPNYDASANLLKALNIRNKDKDQWGQNASYSHLTDYYSKKKPDSALFYANKMYQTAKILKSPDDQLEALLKLIRLSPAHTTKQYFELYQELSDSLYTVRNSAKNQFALILYETEKSKADNLKLQKENTERKYEVAIRDFLIAAGLIAFIAVGMIAFLWYRKRKEKIQSDARKSISQNQLRTSKKVHDVVANGLYRVMTEIENQLKIDREEILNRLDGMYQKSRDISYEAEDFKLGCFEEKIADLLKSFKTQVTTIVIKGNSKDLWNKLSVDAQYEIEHVLQELMVNMKKHSHATKTKVLFEQKDDKINITYTDNGIGMLGQINYNNGLRNTGNRMEKIHGKIIFDTKVKKGLKIYISFPIS